MADGEASGDVLAPFVILTLPLGNTPDWLPIDSQLCVKVTVGNGAIGYFEAEPSTTSGWVISRVLRQILDVTVLGPYTAELGWFAGGVFLPSVQCLFKQAC